MKTFFRNANSKKQRIGIGKLTQIYLEFDKLGYCGIETNSCEFGLILQLNNTQKYFHLVCASMMRFFNHHQKSSISIRNHFIIIIWNIGLGQSFQFTQIIFLWFKSTFSITQNIHKIHHITKVVKKFHHKSTRIK